MLVGFHVTTQACTAYNDFHMYHKTTLCSHDIVSIHFFVTSQKISLTVSTQLSIEAVYRYRVSRTTVDIPVNCLFLSSSFIDCEYSSRSTVQNRLSQFAHTLYGRFLYQYSSLIYNHNIYKIMIRAQIIFCT